MAILPLNLTRVSNLMLSENAMRSIDSTQSQLAQVENELTTGKRVNVPSDDPAAASVISNLQKALARQDTYATNLTSELSNLGQTDSTLGSLKNLLDQAQSIASANVGSDVTDAQRASAASVVQSLYDQAMDLANTSLNGLYVFGGDGGSAQPYSQGSSGIVATPSTQGTLTNQVSDTLFQSFQISGQQVFGGAAAGVTGSADVTPALRGQTRIGDLRGAGYNGVRPGQISVSDGTVTKIVDLSGADTAGDVVKAINAAGVGSVTASLSGGAIQLAGNATENISVAEAGSTTAADLGILNAAGAGAGVALVGQDLHPKVTPLTQLSALNNGAGIDLSGLKISNGPASKAIGLTGLSTVGDLLNAVNGAGLNVQAKVNAGGTGIDVVNLNQNTDLSVGENGGSTATQLGIRTMTTSTPLSSLNNGGGVHSVAGGDFTVARTDGTAFTVSLTGAKTVQDAIDRINAAAAASPDGGGGAGLTAALAGVGNGIALTDTAGGAGTLKVTQINASTAASDLGLTAPGASSGAAAITGADAGQAQADGIFRHLQDLVAALQTSNQGGITKAATGLSADTNRVIAVRGQTGVIEQDLTARQTQMQAQNTSTQSMISSLQDTDFTQAIVRFQNLQTALQASLQTTAKTLNRSLMDFLG